MSLHDAFRFSEVNGKKVQIQLLPAKQGFKHALTLSKVLLPTLGAGLDATDSLSEGGFTRAAFVVVEQMDQIDVMDIINDMLKGMVIDEKDVDFDNYFRANYGELIEILEFALKENFGSFFEAKGLKQKFMELKSKMILDTMPTEQSE